MRGARTWWLKFVALPLVLFSLLVPATALADTKPYFKVFNGDVMAGGWFNSGASSCSTSDSNYQAPTFSPLTNQYEGGILGFATSSRTGASADFGAFALGLIEGNSASSYGFYTAASGTNSLSFSNTNNASGSYWGGYWAGATPQIQCIPDYYDTKQSSPTNLGTASSVDLSSLASGQYIVTPSGSSVNLASAATQIANGKDITLFVNGNAYFGNNLTFASGYNANSVPKLAIVVEGEVYIDPSVSELDGLYIAQPSSGSTGGDIWTCHDSSNSAPDGFYIRNNCTNKLTINGAVIAKQVNFLRVNGDLASAPANETASSNNIAEVINYVPAMVLGGTFFNATASQTPAIQSLISLPPVF